VRFDLPGKIPMLDYAYRRTRYDGYIRFQEEVGARMYAYLRNSGDCEKC
jgi:hypothetical protein